MRSLKPSNETAQCCQTPAFTACGAPAKGETVTLSDGDLAGSRGVLSTENGKTYFYLQLDTNSYAKVELS